MNWLNIKLVNLRSPEYIGSEPVARATWLNVAAYCAEQENGGTIKGAKGWKDRQWQQTCGVTLDEVTTATKLMTFEGDDLVVWNYPVEKEAEIQSKREAGKVGGNRSGDARTKQTLAVNPSTASTSPPSTASSLPSTEGERKEKENRKEKGSASLPVALATPEFSAAWERFITYRKRQKYKTLLPESVESLWRKMEGWGVVAAICQIEETISNGWQGVFAPKAENGRAMKPKMTPIPTGEAKPYDAPRNGL